MDEDQQDFAAKLTVIEWGANLVLEDSPPSPIRDCVQNIATGRARDAASRLEVASSRVQEDFAAKLVLIEIQNEPRARRAAARRDARRHGSRDNCRRGLVRRASQREKSVLVRRLQL